MEAEIKKGRAYVTRKLAGKQIVICITAGGPAARPDRLRPIVSSLSIGNGLEVVSKPPLGPNIGVGEKRLILEIPGV